MTRPPLVIGQRRRINSVSISLRRLTDEIDAGAAPARIGGIVAGTVDRAVDGRLNAVLETFDSQPGFSIVGGDN